MYFCSGEIGATYRKRTDLTIIIMFSHKLRIAVLHLYTIEMLDSHGEIGGLTF